MPNVVLPDNPSAETFVNQDIEAALGGGGYTEVAAIPEREKLQMGDSRTDCSNTVASRDVVAFVCQEVSMGAHPYETTIGLAYDLRPRLTKRLTSADLFSDTGAMQLKNIVTARAREQAAARGVPTDEIVGHLDPLELHRDGLLVTFDRCSLGACIYGGAVVKLSCAEVRPALREGAAWRCDSSSG